MEGGVFAITLSLHGPYTILYYLYPQLSTRRYKIHVTKFGRLYSAGSVCVAWWHSVHQAGVVGLGPEPKIVFSTMKITMNLQIPTVWKVLLCFKQWNSPLGCFSYLSLQLRSEFKENFLTSTSHMLNDCMLIVIMSARQMKRETLLTHECSM